MHYTRHTAAALCHGTVGRSGTGSSPRRAQPTRRRVTRGSGLIGTAWHLLTTENFTVPLHMLYKRSFAGHALHRCAGALHICAVASVTVHICPVPSAPPIAHDIDSHVCGLPPTCRAQEYQLARWQHLCGYRWQQLATPAKSPKLLCMPLTRMCWEHIHACLSRRVWTALL